MEARVTSQSQSYRLMERMQEAKISHGQEIRADLPNIKVVALAGVGEAQALFCTMGPIGVREIFNRGDDRPLPTDVTLEGLHVSTSGTYDILNAFVCANGSVRLVVDTQTRVVPVARAVDAAWPGRGLAPAAGAGRRESPELELEAPIFGPSGRDI